MQQVRPKLDRLQQDPTQTPSTSIIGIMPKQLLDQQDFHDKDQGRTQAGHENYMYVDSYPTREQQIQADVKLPRHLHEEEHI